MLMIRFVAIASLVVGVAGHAEAQPVGTPISKLSWDQPAPDLATAQSYGYKLYADGATTGTAAPSVTCVAGSTASLFTCSAAFPAFTPGAHSLQISASNAAGESAKSAPLSFTFVVIPAAPANLRIGG